MPTSKKRSECARANLSRPVPDGIAAVIAQIRGSASASRASASPNTFWYWGGPGGALACAPVMTSNFWTP